MSNFKKNKITVDADEVAREFREKREKKKIDLERAAKDTGISRNYILAMEEGNFNRLPKGIYRKKIVSEYANYLGVACGPFLRQLKPSAIKEDADKVFFNKRAQDRYLYWPKIFKNLAILLFFAIFFVYLWSEVGKIMEPPRLEIYSPADNLVSDGSQIEIVGQTEPEAEVEINGEPVLIDLAGNFKEVVNLKKGANIIIIEAQRKYSRKITIKRQILN